MWLSITLATKALKFHFFGLKFDDYIEGIQLQMTFNPATIKFLNAMNNVVFIFNKTNRKKWKSRTTKKGKQMHCLDKNFHKFM